MAGQHDKLKKELQDADAAIAKARVVLSDAAAARRDAYRRAVLELSPSEVAKLMGISRQRVWKITGGSGPK